MCPSGGSRNQLRKTPLLVENMLVNFKDTLLEISKSNACLDKDGNSHLPWLSSDSLFMPLCIEPELESNTKGHCPQPGPLTCTHVFRSIHACSDLLQLVCKCGLCQSMTHGATLSQIFERRGLICRTHIGAVVGASRLCYSWLVGSM